MAIQELKQQVTKARSQLEEEKRKVEQQRKYLEEAKKRLPERKSQEVLRKELSGLKGRQVRRTVKSKEQEISGRVGKIKEYEEEKIKPFEEQIKKVESQISDYERDVQARALAKRLYFKGIPTTAVSGVIKKYLQDFYRDASLRKIKVVTAKLPEVVSTFKSSELYKAMADKLPKENILEKGIAKKEKIDRTRFVVGGGEKVTTEKKGESKAYLKEEVVETFDYPGRVGIYPGKKDVPSTRLYYYSGTGEKRLATKEEEEYFNSKNQNVLIASEKKPSRFSGIIDASSLFKEDVKTRVGETLKETKATAVWSFLNPIKDYEKKYSGVVGSSWLASVVAVTRLPKVQQVQFIGVTQKGKQPIQTQVYFEAGKKKGVAEALTYTKQSGKNIYGATKVEGLIIKKGGLKHQPFSSYEGSISRNTLMKITAKGDFVTLSKTIPTTETISGGVFKFKNLYSKYVGVNVGIPKGKFIISGGLSRTLGKGSVTTLSEGLLKVTARTPSTTFIPGSSAITTLPSYTSLAQQQASASVQNVISSVVKTSTQPRTFLPISQVTLPTLQTQTQTKIEYPKISYVQTQQVTKPKTATITIQKTSQQPLQRTKSLSAQLYKTKQKEEQLFAPASISLQESIQKIKQTQRFAPLSITLQKSIQKVKQAKQSTQPTGKPTPIIFKFGESIKKAKAIAKEKPEIFEAFITKLGKEVSLGKKQTQTEAEQLLKGKIRGTLSAGGFIMKGSKKLKAKELKTFGGGEFRLSKASSFKIIERKERRLRKGTTGKQVQFFRKKSNPKRIINF